MLFRSLTLQQKKLSMLMADNQQYLGRLRVLDIRLSQEFIHLYGRINLAVPSCMADSSCSVKE